MVPLSARVPPPTIVPPVKLLLPPSTRMPVPSLVRPPGPLMLLLHMSMALKPPKAAFIVTVTLEVKAP